LNILLFTDADKLAADRVKIGGYRLEHLRNVLKVQEGDEIRVGELGGKLGRGTVLKLDKGAATLAVTLDSAPPQKLPLSLVLALPRPKMLRRILRTVAELGIAQLHLINSYRVEKSYWGTPALQASKIQDYFIQGLEQARDTIAPTVHIHKRFKPFVEDQLPALLADKRGLAAHPGDYPLCPHNIAQDTVLLIGPEGGFIPYEVEKLQQAGCEIVTLGSRILRVENAVTSIVGRLF
jgi:RsmE family RNA methyltransferase